MFRLIDCGLWGQPWFEDLAPDAKLFYLYLYSSERSNPAGAYQITLRTASLRTNLVPSRVTEVIEELGEHVVWWPEHQVIWIRDFYIEQRANDKFRIGAVKALAVLPAEVRQTVTEHYPELRDGAHTPSAGPDTVSIPTPNGIDTVSVVTGTETVAGTETGEGAASPPAPAIERRNSALGKKATRAGPIPRDWRPSDRDVAWATGSLAEAGLGLPADYVTAETARFVDVWIGSGKPKADWAATWRAWLRKEIQDGKAPSGRHPPGQQARRNGAGPYLPADQGIDWDEEERQARERRVSARREW